MPHKRSSPLLERHRELGAKLTEFGGWEMPLQYAGIIAEHNAVRTAAGVFDVSHLGKLRLRPDEGDALDRTVTADIHALEPDQATYALVLTDDGGCIDDVFVYRLGDEGWLVVPNAANVAAVAQALEDSGGEPADEWDRWAILALQGPSSFNVFARAWPDSPALRLGLHRWCPIELLGCQGLVARTGYTGERGFEIYAPAEAAVGVFDRLVDLGATPAGLGARDTLRLEMGYALYGHEISLDINPLEAGLGWTIAWDTPFRGRDALEKVRAEGPRRRLFGLRCTDRGVPRQGYRVLRDGEAVGELVSGNFSPTLNTGIGTAIGPRETRPVPGERVEIEARGRRIGADIVKPPFIEKRPAATPAPEAEPTVSEATPGTSGATGEE